MTVRKTESAIPDGYSAADLGESHSLGNYHLVSFLTSPIRAQEINSYVVFCEDAENPDQYTYEWVFIENSNQVHSETTEEGYIAYENTIENSGMLEVLVHINVNASYEATLALQQEVGLYNPQLEVLLDGDWPVTGPMIALGGDPVTTREIVYDFSSYIKFAALQTGENGIHPLILASIAYRESVFRPKVWKASHPHIVGPYLRNYEMELKAAEIEGNESIIGAMIDQQESSIGVCQIKPAVAAMVLGMTPWRELPMDVTQRNTIRNEIFSNYEGLSETEKINLFNLLRFPRTNIMVCGKLLTEIKNRTRSVTRRWGELTKLETLGNRRAIQIIGTEYNLGATSTPSELAKPTDYGKDIYTLTVSPYLRPFFLDEGVAISKPGMTFDQAHQNGFNVGNRTKKDIDSFVVHTIEGTSGSAISWFKNPASGVSAHYVISKEGVITQMVNIKDIAFTSNYYNQRSISVECEGFANVQETWTEALMDSLAKLLAWCCYEYEIPPFHPTKIATSNSDKLDEPGIVGHNQIHGYPPFNKSDPGPFFNWNQLISDVHTIMVGLE